MESRGRTAVVVVNPTKVDVEAVRETLGEAARASGVAEPELVETTAEDPGQGQARAAVEAGAELVCALGGDGTVRAVAEALVGTDVALGLLPGGTGNLLARNLTGGVDSLEDAARTAFAGADRRIDVGWLVSDPTPDQLHGLPTPADNVHLFAVMAGVGFDAQMMADAPEGVKAKVGWAAYVVSGRKHLTDEPFSHHLDVDGETLAEGPARTVVVGNCGELTGGMVLFPDADLDDGRLDIATMSPESLTQWIAETARVLTGRTEGPHLARTHGRDVLLRIDPPQLCEVDGDVLTEASVVRFVVAPSALTVRVAR